MEAKVKLVQLALLRAKVMSSVEPLIAVVGAPISPWHCVLIYTTYHYAYLVRRKVILEEWSRACTVMVMLFFVEATEETWKEMTCADRATIFVTPNAGSSHRHQFLLRSHF